MYDFGPEITKDVLNDSKIAQLNSERPLHQTAVFSKLINGKIKFFFNTLVRVLAFVGTDVALPPLGQIGLRSLLT